MGPLPPLPDGRGGQLGLFFAKFSQSGELLWLRSFVATDPTYGYRPILPGEVATDAEGSLILTGSVKGELDLGGGPLTQTTLSTSGFVAKFSWNGRHLWSRGFRTDYEFLTSVVTTAAKDPSGNIFVGGLSSPGSDLGGGTLGTFGPFIAKYTPAGSLLWARVFSGWYYANRILSLRPLDASTPSGSSDLFYLQLRP